MTLWPVLVSGVLLAAGATPGSSPAAEASPKQGFTASLTGTVTDESGSPLGGVMVKVFAKGLLIESTKTNGDGAYSIEFVIDPDLDETVAVWWEAPRANLVSEIALVREGGADRALGLWGPCVPRIGIRRHAEWPVRILDRLAFRRRAADSGCVGGGRVRPERDR